MRNRLLAPFFVVAALICLLGEGASAASGITYQGRILKPDGSPLEGNNIQFRLQIRTPGSQNCLMYEEIKALDMRHSKGLFSLTINDGLGARTDSSGFGLDRIFANRGTFNFAAITCVTGNDYTPSTDDGRRLQVHFKDETMSSWEPMPATNINYVPFAFESKQVQGFTATSLVRVQEADGTMGNIAPLSNANYLDLLNLVGGTSPNYVRASNGAGARVPVVTGNPLSAVAGSVWFDSVSGKLKFHDGSSPVDVGGGAGGGVTEVTAGSGLVTSPGAGITATGSIAIAVGGVVTNMLADGAVTTIKIGDSQVTDLKLAANSVIEAKIANGAVTSAKILDGTIAGSDLAPDITISTTGSVTASGVTTTGNVTVGGDVVVTGGVSTTTVTSGTNITRQIQLFDPDTSSVNKITFTADAALNADYTLKWPLNAGSANQVLSTDGLGNLSWVNASSGADNLGNHTATQNIQLGNHWLSGDGGNEGLRVDANGNVGIGTTTPGSMLHLSGGKEIISHLNTSTTLSSGEDWLDLRNTSTTLGSMHGIAFRTNNNTTYSAGINAVNRGGTAGSDLMFATKEPGFASSEKLRITGEGNVGIGTTTPMAKLEVAGDSLLNGITAGLGGGQIDSNTAFGLQTLTANTTGTFNTGFGRLSLASNTTGSFNTAFGQDTLYQNTTGSTNTAFGAGVLRLNTTGSYNVGVGSYVLVDSTTGAYNSALGHRTLNKITTGGYNSAVGGRTLWNATTASNNSAVGYEALGAITTGANNIALGYMAGGNISTGMNNIVIGYNVSAPQGTANHQLNVGNLIFGTNVDGSGATISSGNIGIGTASPQTRLDVAGAIRVGDSVTCGAPTAGSIRYNGGNLQLCNGTSWQTLSAGGSDSFAALPCGDGFIPYKASGAWGCREVASINSNNTVITRDISGNFASNSATLNSLSLNNAGSIVQIQNPLGAVYTLTLPPTAGSANQVLQTNGVGVLSWVNQSVGGGGDFKADGSVPMTGNIRLGANYLSGDGDNEGLRINANGNVGIGTVTPASALDVTGTISIDGVNGLRYPASDAVTGGSIAIGPSALANQDALASSTFINTAIGYQAMGGGAMTTAANASTAIGYQALKAVTSGSGITAVGSGALASNTSGNANTAFGRLALGQLTLGSSNTVVGNNAGTYIQGSENTVVGFSAMYQGGSSRQRNTAIGRHALYSPGTGGDNTMVGNRAGYGNTTGNGNVMLGNSAGADATTGSYNIVIGSYVTAGVGVTTGSNNILVGQDVRPVSQTASNQLNIGNLIYATDLGVGSTASVGNVGIGTASPQALLDVNGTLRSKTTLQGAAAYVDSAAAYTIPDTSLSVRRIRLTSNATITLPAFASVTPQVYELTIILKQDATGSRVINFLGSSGDTVIFSGGSAYIGESPGVMTIIRLIKVSDEPIWYGTTVWSNEPTS